MSRRAPAVDQTLVSKEAAKPSKRAMEVAGGRLAECVAVVCCCPCGLINLLVLTVVKLPAGVFRRTVKKKKKKTELFRQDAKSPALKAAEPMLPLPAKSPAAEVLETEQKMLPQFINTGFWRSPSQKDIIANQ